ncbi:MAG: hypothetical protein LAT55_04995, partial [Opitutales bacterium]|nr:hypothetical protein [Opitutales bacterium]
SSSGRVALRLYRRTFINQKDAGWEGLAGHRAQAQRDLPLPAERVPSWEGEGLSEFEWSGCDADSRRTFRQQKKSTLRDRRVLW